MSRVSFQGDWWHDEYLGKDIFQQLFHFKKPGYASWESISEGGRTDKNFKQFQDREMESRGARDSTLLHMYC